MPNESRHYFDWASTAVPEYPQLEAQSRFGNPSSLHREGRLAKEALESARTRCASVLKVPPETLYFTSGGTESNCIVLFSHIARQSGGRITASVGEHSSITENLRILDRLGRQTGVIPIDPLGRVTDSFLSETLTKYNNVRFAAIMAVNNETGTVNDIVNLGKIIVNREPPIHFHCDMVQAVGKIPIDICGSGVDSASFSAHKIGGPRGIGLLYLRKPLEVLYSGGGQEKGIRPGTENVSGALAMAQCLETLPETVAAEYGKAKARCGRLISSLKQIGRCRLIPADRESNDYDSDFSPYIVQAAFKDIPGEVMARALDDLGFAVSTGSACSSSKQERPVLAAMGIDGKTAFEGIRISQGWSTADEEIDLLLAAIQEVLKSL